MTTTTPSPLIIDDLYTPDGVVRSSELTAAGVSHWHVSIRCRPGGAWQRVLPGVVLLSGSPPTPRQLLRAALVYAGEGAVATGIAAMREHDLDVRGDERVHVLIPGHRRVNSAGHVTVERSKRLPLAAYATGLAVAPIVRSTVDASRREQDPERMHTLLTAPVKAGLCGFGQLRTELDAGNQRGTAAPRAILAGLATELSSLTRARARRVLRGTPLPTPHWDARLRTAGKAGDRITVDAWWPETRLAWILTETGAVDGPHPLANTAATVVRTHVFQLRDNPDAVSRQLATAFMHGLLSSGASTTSRVPDDP